jgi:hypothetical protein
VGVVEEMRDIIMPNGPTRKRMQREFRFTHLHGYKGDRLIVGFYETYIKPFDKQHSTGTEFQEDHIR